MHELGIAQSIIATVLAEIKTNDYGRVSAIGVRVGELTDIVDDALIFGFEAMTKKTILEGASIQIERVKLLASCCHCHKDFQVEEYSFICPSCQSGEVEIITGQELEISFLEIDD